MVNHKHIILLEEPLLSFNNGVSVYAKYGLSEYGPYESQKNINSNTIILGAIGTKELLYKTSKWIESINNSISSRPHGFKENISKALFPDFPGADVSFNSRIILPESYTQIISLSEIAKLDKSNAVSYIEELLKLYTEKILRIKDNNEILPNVILLLINDDMYEICHIVGNYHAKLRKKKFNPAQYNLFQDLDQFSDNDYSFEEEKPFYKNFRSELKKIAMSPDISVPIQLVREHTVDPESEFTQNAATKAWNFCTALYYKSGKHPWILNNIDQDTCFLGISFFHKKDHYQDDVYTSMAHLFANDFDDIVLRGQKVEFDETLGSPFLDYSKANSLIKEALTTFERIKGILPKRIVIHKTSIFNDDEISAFSEEFNKLKIIYDLVSLRKSPFKLIRYGSVPVPRGTFYKESDNRAYLYTKGYIPSLKTYPGVFIPSPFEIMKAKGDSSYEELCSEILALTKLNWNTADFCSGLPITLGFSKNVGLVLKVFGEEDKYSPKINYRYYM